MATYACSDLHGHLEIYKMIKKYIRPDDKVYYLGDAGDRGPQCWETIKAIYYDEQFVYIFGNHERLLIESMYDYLHPSGRASEAYMLLVQNGGLRTFDGWEKEEKKEEWQDWIGNLPSFETYRNAKGQTVYLTHAGFTPYWSSKSKDIWLPEDFDLWWDRSHFRDKWDEEHFSDAVVVHGHTPGHYLHRELGHSLDDFKVGAYWYCDNHKVCVDCGTIVTKTTCLLNLDTWESRLFRI